MAKIMVVLFLIALSGQVYSGKGVTCIDYRNFPVKEIATTKINDIAQAQRVHGFPVIFFNPIITKSVARPTERFFFWHECAHHVLAHMERANPFTREQEADCWAIKKLASTRGFTGADLEVLQIQLATFGRGDQTHLPGPTRATNLERCLYSI